MKQCLLIDDDRDDQEIFLMCVESISNTIICRGIDDSSEALSLLERDANYTPDYIFIDVNMPKINGIQCLAILKTIERLAATKIFMYSTTSASATFLETKSMGADDFIIKPASIVELKETLRKVFNIVPD